MSQGDASRFYDELAEDYHLIFADWDRSIRWQADVLKRLLDAHDRPVRRVLDASCGIGTQALGLAAAGYDVTAADISEASVRRCAREAADRGLNVQTGVADFRTLDRDVAGRFDCAVTFDNALPHLLSDEDLASACAALRDVLVTGGLLCASIRDYDAILEQRPSGELPRIHRVGRSERLVFQAWEWSERRYTVRHFMLDRRDGAWEVAERRTTYRALTRAELASALGAAGFTDVTWRMPEETGFYQPIVTARATSQKHS
jgi:glycine/sarcosine N-methyltransferase